VECIETEIALRFKRLGLHYNTISIAGAENELFDQRNSNQNPINRSSVTNFG